MMTALSLARRNLGDVWPNPAVGCILVRDGVVLGRGWTGRGGRPHAETEALRQAREAAAGATAYVTLEPCDHHGETPPCSQALIKAGIRRAVVAVEDPDPRVSGRGNERMVRAHIEVSIGVLADEARDLNEGFFFDAESSALFTLKSATTLDGRIATRTGESRWITGERARAMAHRLRAEHDAVLVGSGTAIADDPELTCRLPGLGKRSPVRIVADGRLRLPESAKLVKQAGDLPTWILTSSDASSEKRDKLVAAGVEVIDVMADEKGRMDATAMAKALGECGLTRVLIEGGGVLAASFLTADLVDRVAWFRSPKVFGGDARPVAAEFGITQVRDAPTFVRTGVYTFGDDTLETYRRTR